MMRRISWLLAVLMTFSAHASARANDDVPPSEPNDAALIDERIAFVKAFYELDDGALNGLRAALEERLPAHGDYMNRNELTLRRRTAALATAVPQELKAGNPHAAALKRSYQETIYQIREQAPLSVSESVKIAEGLIAPAARDAGRAKIRQFFAKQLNGQTFDPGRLDRLVLAPVEPLDVTSSEPLASVNRKQMQSNDRSRRGATMTDAEKARLEAARIEAMRSRDTGPTKAVAPPPPANRSPESVTLNAPPLEQWETEYQTWATAYDFTPAQRKVAQSIYDQSMRRAEGLTDGDGKQALDRVFTEMKQRIDSVASIEQRERLRAANAGEAPTKDSDGEKAP